MGYATNTLNLIEDDTQLYFITNTKNNTIIAYWIASPSNDNNNYVYGIGYTGYLGREYFYIDSELGIRPVVILDSDIQIEKNKTTGKWE